MASSNWTTMRAEDALGTMTCGVCKRRLDVAPFLWRVDCEHCRARGQRLNAAAGRWAWDHSPCDGLTALAASVS